MLKFVPRPAADAAPIGSLPGWFSALLRSRGADTEEKARRFLRPGLSDLHDAAAITGVPEAAALLRGAAAAGTPVLVYGDYDVDGVCASAILLETLREEGARADFRIPSRHEEGYGLNEAAVREIARDYGLLITVDCGVSSVKEVALARELGLTVIVTDHHEPPEVLPPADVIVDPLLGEAPFRRLCGAGVALKLCQALQGIPGVEKRLDLAALATVADVVPLEDENRVIVREGLLRMADSRRPGIRALLECAGIAPPVTAEHLAFRLGPRINAAGRLEEAGQAVRLLTTGDPGEAQAVARHLEENNRRRQDEEQAVLKQAEAQILAGEPFREGRVLIAAGEGWNSGLIGLVAGKLCEKYHFPAIVLSLQGETAVGSCRSIPGVNIYQMLSLCAGTLVRFGGHAQAAGLTVETSRIPEFRDSLNRAIRENCDEACFPPVREYDLELPFREWTPEALRLLDLLEPTGCGNPAPVFLVSEADVQEMRRVGRDGSHLKLSLLDPAGKLIDGIAFSMGDEADRGRTRVDALYSPALNEYKGRVSVQLRVQALRPSPGSVPKPSEDALFRSLLQELSLLPANEQETPASPVSREEMAAFLRQPLGTLALTRSKSLAASLAQETGADPEIRKITDPRGFSAVLCGWDPAALADRWQRVILADGALPGEADWIREKCPHAEVLTASPEAVRQQLQDLAVTYAELGALYRTLKAVRGIPGLGDLARLSGLNRKQAMVGLQAFWELGLLDWNTDPFFVRLKPSGFSPIENSPLIRWLTRNGLFTR